MKRTDLLSLLLLPLLLFSCSRSEKAAIPSGTEVRVDTLLLVDAVQSGRRIIAVGERGRIIYTDDQGETWNRASVPTEATLTAVYFIDEAHGWAVGHDSVILRSSDGGRTWTKTHEAPEREGPLLSVAFQSLLHGYAAGAYGQFYVTRDGGKTWTVRQAPAEDLHANSIALDADGAVFVAGEAGVLRRSDDGGATWRTLPSPYQGSYFGLLRHPAGPLIVYGLRGRAFRSLDGGLTWHPIRTSTDVALLGGTVAGDGSIILTGYDGTVLISTDRGKSFELRRHPGRKALGKAVRLSGTELLLFGEAGVQRMKAGE